MSHRRTSHLLCKIGGCTSVASVPSARQALRWLGIGTGVVRPHDALLVLSDRVPVAIVQLSEMIRQGVRIQLELTLEGAIGHACFRTRVRIF